MRGPRALCATLVRPGVALVAIERPDGLLVERLLDAGPRVMAPHPNQVHAARPRFRASDGQSDRFDAFVPCEPARTDSHRFRVLMADSDATKALRALSRAREDLVQSRVELANPLRAELERFWPGAATVFGDVDSAIALAFLQRDPSPADARGPGEQHLAAFFARHGHRARKPAAALLEKLRAAPEGRAGDSETQARRQVVLAYVAALRPIVPKITELTSKTAHRLHAHPDGHVFLSSFRDPRSVACAAAPLAEIADRRARHPTAKALAADAGTSAAAIESTKHKVACFRRRHDKRLKDATTTLADTTRHWHPWAADRYPATRPPGQDHPPATRTLGRTRSRVTRRRWQHGVAYDPARHRGPQQHITATIAHPTRPGLDLIATQRMGAAAGTHHAARTAKREALDSPPSTATRPD